MCAVIIANVCSVAELSFGTVEDVVVVLSGNVVVPVAVVVASS